jgi:shikimate kinase
LVFIDYNIPMYKEANNHSEPSESKLQSGNLILVGMMGSGKTTMGRFLAKQLGKRFIDTDEEIQRRTGVTIPHIFDVEGEDGFRARETATIGDLLQYNGLVLATGGGAVVAEANRELLARGGLVIYLKGGVSDLYQRTRHDRGRPLLQTADPRAKLTELLLVRDPLYHQVADIVVHTGRQSVHALMHHLISEIDAYTSRKKGE